MGPGTEEGSGRGWLSALGFALYVRQMIDLKEILESFLISFFRNKITKICLGSNKGGLMWLVGSLWKQTKFNELVIL